jgi:hypothetical protein
MGFLLVAACLGGAAVHGCSANSLPSDPDRGAGGTNQAAGGSGGTAPGGGGDQNVGGMPAGGNGGSTAEAGSGGAVVSTGGTDGGDGETSPDASNDGPGAGGSLGGGGATGNPTCPVGTRRCACTATGSCDTGLLCLDHVCIGIAMGGMTGTAGDGGVQQGGDSGTGGRDAGGQGGQGGSGTPGSCPSTPGATTCRQCIDQKCCGPLGACQGSEQCVALLTCLGNCADTDYLCVNTCADAHQAGVTPLNNLFDCLDGQCVAECPASLPTDAGADGSTPPVGDGGANACPDPPNATACRTCVDQKCCPQFNACNDMPICRQFSNCLSACGVGDTACEMACATRYPAGVAPLDAFAQCGDQNCASSCL